MFEKIKENKLKYLHIAIIILGIIFITIPIFHTNMWMDESYSIALSSNHGYAEIWKIDSHDVHPPLYYWILHTVALLTNNNIIAYRILSMIALALLGIFGYTHIRKDYGEKTGLIFSFLTFFLPTNCVYAGEIRMYTFAMLFATVMFVYACRILKNITKLEYNKKENIKNWVIFGLSSLALAYTHYYGLITAGLANLVLMIHVIRLNIKPTENKENKKSNLILFLIQGVIEVVLYLPWLIQAFFGQLKTVSGGFWIKKFEFFRDVPTMISFQITGNLEKMVRINDTFAFIFGLAILIYLIVLLIKNRKDKETKIPAFALVLYLTVLIIVGLYSIIRPILYARYMLVITGLLMIFISYMCGKYGNKWINGVILSALLIMSIFVNVNLQQTNYDKDDYAPIDYIKSEINDKDIFIYGNNGSGLTMGTNFQKNQRYFYNKQYWTSEEAYRAYEPNMKTIYNLDELKDYKGKIWVIGDHDYDLANELKDKLENTNIVSEKQYTVKYEKYNYSIALLEKN